MPELAAAANSVLVASNNVLSASGSRYSGAVPLLMVSAPVSLLAVVGALAVAGASGTPEVSVAFLGSAAGLLGGLALALSFRLFQVVPVSIAVPVTTIVASGALSLVGQARQGVSVLATLGLAVSAVAVVIIARSSHPDDLPAGGPSRRGTGAAVAGCAVVGLGFAAFAVLLSYVPQGSGLWALLTARSAVTLVALVLVATASAPTGALLDRRLVILGSAVGLLDVAANMLLLLALSSGSLAAIAVITSTSPVIAALLAVAFAGERLTRSRVLGLMLSCAAVAIVSIGSI